MDYDKRHHPIAGARVSSGEVVAAEATGESSGTGADDIGAAVERGIAYLRRIRMMGDRWFDYQLRETGRSDQWVTAYVAYSLAGVAAHGFGDQVGTMVDQAADWLTRERAYSSGWGYNGMSGPDADSTAFTIALLRRLGRDVRREDREFLRRHWKSRGGVSTFLKNSAWGVAHPDVTPLAFLGLPEAVRQRYRPTLLNFLRRTRLSTGMWPSYWWRQPRYATYQMLRMLRELGEDETWLPAPTEPEHGEPIGPFDTACALGIQSLRGRSERSVAPLVRSLLAAQRPDGGWEGGDNLRVPEPDCYKPWENFRGYYYTDMAGTITVATVLSALTELIRRRN